MFLLKLFQKDKQSNARKISQHKPRLISTNDQPDNGYSDVYIQKPSTDKENLFVQNLQNQLIFRTLYSLNNQSLIIQNCQQCNFYMLDLVKQINIDDCFECNFFLIGCSGSLFVRDSRNCSFSAVCGQLRTRNLTNCHFYLYVKTQPIIESSAQVKFSPFLVTATEDQQLIVQYSNDINQLLKYLQFQVCQNHFNDVYDFTPGASNYEVRYFPESTDLQPIVLVQFQATSDVMTESTVPQKGGITSLGLPLCGVFDFPGFKCAVDQRIQTNIGILHKLYTKFGLFGSGNNQLKVVIEGQQVNQQDLEDYITTIDL